MSRRLVLLIVLALGALTAAALAGNSIPQELLGKYSRTIPAKALATTGFPQGAGVWSITFMKDRTVFVQGPGAISSYQHLTATAGGTLTFRDEFCAPRDTGRFRWQLSGKTLKLTNVSDKCHDRGAILSGSWKRKG